MADIYVKSGGGTIGSGSYRGNWTASSTYALGDRVCGVAVSDYWIFECTTAGTSAGTEPTWVKTADSTTTDNTVTWTARIPSTWANATFTLAKAAANDAAGDTIYVSQAHAESSAAAQTITLGGTSASPNRIICGNDGAEPPTAVATTATVTTTGNNSITTSGSAYIYGISFVSGSSLNIATNASNSYKKLESCQLTIASTASNVLMQLASGTSGLASNVELLNTNLKFGHISQTLRVSRCTVSVVGGSIASGSSQLTTFVSTSGETSVITIRDFDLSNMSSALNLCTCALNPGSGSATFINCKLPASWSGSLFTGTNNLNPNFRASMYNCDSGATNYRLWIETYAGSIKSETTLVKSGGATDGTTPISWKLATTANANEYVAPLITDDMAVWIDSGLGSPKTITVDILHDSATALTDSEVWVEIDYLGASNSPLGTPASDKRATVLTTPANHPASTATWFTTGITTPNKQKLEVTFTPNMRGFVYARVCLAKPSYTVYVDPQPVII